MSLREFRLRLRAARLKRKIRTHRVLFFHIPKTGGTVIRHFLLERWQHLGAASCFVVDDRSQIGYVGGSYDDLLTYRINEPALKFVAGHMPMPPRRLLKSFVSVTCLRDPLERALSAYWHCYHSKEHAQHPLARSMDPASFILTGHAGNQLSYLSGSAYGKAFSSAKEELSRARQNLKLFDIVLIQDRFEDTVRCLEYYFIKRKKTSGFDWTRKLVSHSRLRKMTAKEEEHIRQFYEMDYIVYNDGWENFQAHLGGITRGNKSTD